MSSLSGAARGRAGCPYQTRGSCGTVTLRRTFALQTARSAVIWCHGVLTASGDGGQFERTLSGFHNGGAIESLSTERGVHTHEPNALFFFASRRSPR